MPKVLRRGFFFKMPNLSGLSKADYQAQMNALNAKYQSWFDPKAQQDVRGLKGQLSADQLERVELVSDHLLDLTIEELLLLKKHIKQTRAKQISPTIDWPVFERESKIKYGPEEKQGPLRHMGFYGYSAEALEKILSGELFKGAQAVEEVQQEVKEEVKQEKAVYDLVIKSIDPANKVKVIKLVKDFLGLGLKESKEKVEEISKGPIILYKSVPKATHQEKLDQLKALGADASFE